jgi:hypothetical protein
VSETTTTAAPTRRGRPRPQVTIERDKHVADLLAKGEPGKTWTKHEVATATGFALQVADHCLGRLSWSGVVEKVGRGAYRRTDRPYTPEYDEALMPDRVKSRRASAPAAAAE